MGFYKGQIAKQFIIRILLFSMLITTVLTGIQLYVDYENGLKEIKKNSTLVEVSYLSSIANSVWNYDNDSLNVQLDGLYRVPDIQYINVKTKTLDFSRGEDLTDDVLKHSFPLVFNFNGKDKLLGQMVVSFSLQGLYQRLLDKAIIILFSQGVKTFLVSFFIFYIFYQLVGRYLGDISRYAKNLNEETLAKELVLSKPNIKQVNSGLVDEIDELTNALNEMRINFLSYKQSINDSQSELEYLAMHDALTDLPNRVLLQDRANMVLTDASREEKQIAVLYIDLDGFKQVNDAYGHKVGDKLLVHVANLLKQKIRKSDTVSRLSGDEFVVLLHPADDIDNVAHISQKLIDSIAKSLTIENNEVSVSASIGVSLYPQDGGDFDKLLRHADAAMYKAKEIGKNNVQFYRKEFSDIVEHNILIEHDLDYALAHDELEVYYQPQVDTINNKIIGAEALVRWNSKQRGMVSPAEFIPIAEKTGQIAKIDAWVLKNVASTITRLKASKTEVVKVSVNFSSKEFDRLPLSELINSILQEEQCSAELIEVELTESALMDDPKKCATELTNMREMGLSVAIDDFGTGYSSLSYLKFLPISKLKIDQAFVRDLHFDFNDQSIVNAIIALGDSLGMQLIAEGVETKEQLTFLKDAGCHTIQGYLYSKPLPEKEFIQFLTEYNAG